MRLPVRLVTFVTLVVVAATPAVARAGDEAQIRRLVARVDEKPVTWCTLAMPALIKSMFGTVKKCREAAAKLVDRTPSTVEKISVKGDRATTRISDRNGRYYVKWINRSGRWRVYGETKLPLSTRRHLLR